MEKQIHNSLFTCDISDALTNFCRTYLTWFKRLPEDSPNYAIPSAALLGQELSWLFPADLEIEREFTQLCDEKGIVGWWGNKVIAFKLLDPKPIDLAALAQLGIEARIVDVINRAGQQASKANTRLLGVAGWLLTEPAFQRENQRLQNEYAALPRSERPNFPLTRVLTLNEAEDEAKELRAESTLGILSFAQNVQRFLDRWGLTRLETWDLPEPQGPLLPSLPHGIARPVHGIHLFIPCHYPLQGDDDLMEQVREFQKQQTAQLGLPLGFAAVGHHVQYATIFRLIHLDRAIRGRFKGKPPRGIVSAIESASASYLNISTESVRRLWKWIRACRRGNRQSIPQLKD